MKDRGFCSWLEARGGHSADSRVGRCGPGVLTLTLFKTKISDFATLFKTDFRFFVPCLRHLTQHHTSLQLE